MHVVAFSEQSQTNRLRLDQNEVIFFIFMPFTRRTRYLERLVQKGNRRKLYKIYSMSFYFVGCLAALKDKIARKLIMYHIVILCSDSSPRVTGS